MKGWGEPFKEGGKETGRTFRVSEPGFQKDAMEEAGFVDIQEIEFKVRKFLYLSLSS